MRKKPKIRQNSANYWGLAPYVNAMNLNFWEIEKLAEKPKRKVLSLCLYLFNQAA